MTGACVRKRPLAISEVFLGQKTEAFESVSVVIPVLNSASTLRTLVERVKSALAGVVRELEVVLVDDGSEDPSWETIRQLAEEHPFVHGVRLMRNYGQHNAILAGIRTTRYGVIITMDDDLQHPPEEIPRLLAELARGFDVVYGTPREMPHALWRNVTSGLIKVGLRATTGVREARSLSAFRAFRRELCAAFASFAGSSVSIDVLLSWSTARFGAVVVDQQQRPVGSSNYTFRKLFDLAMTILVGFSDRPLKAVGACGLVTTVLGFLGLVCVVVRCSIGGACALGIPFLACLAVLLCGLQLLALGLVGEYLLRTHACAVGRPPYVIRDVTCCEDVQGPMERNG